MVDKINPTSQFHPYSPTDATPNSERLESQSGLSGMLSRFGIDSSRIGSMGGKLKDMDMKGSVNKARDYARSNPAIALGGLAAAVIGAGLLRRRSM